MYAFGALRLFRVCMGLCTWFSGWQEVSGFLCTERRLKGCVTTFYLIACEVSVEPRLGRFSGSFSAMTLRGIFLRCRTTRMSIQISTSHYHRRRSMRLQRKACSPGPAQVVQVDALMLVIYRPESICSCPKSRGEATAVLHFAGDCSTCSTASMPAWLKQVI